MALSQEIVFSASAEQQADTWDKLTRSALSAETDVSQASWNLLRRDKNIEAEVRDGLHSVHRTEALQLIQAFHLKNLFPELLKDLESTDDALTWRAAISIADGERKKTLSQLVTSKAETSWTYLSNTAKWSLLSSAIELKSHIPAQMLTEVIESDSSYEARIQSARLAGELLRAKSDVAYSEALKKAIQGNPYQLRLEAIRQISRQPASIQEKLRDTLKHCTTDTYNEVQEACNQARKAGAT
jgi:hypothetical protein